MSTLSDVARMLKAVRKEKSWSQDELAHRAGVARTTLARMETMARGDMSVSVLLRLLDAAGYDLKVVARPFSGTCTGGYGRRHTQRAVGGLGMVNFLRGDRRRIPLSVLSFLLPEFRSVDVRGLRQRLLPWLMRRMG